MYPPLLDHNGRRIRPTSPAADVPDTPPAGESIDGAIGARLYGPPAVRTPAPEPVPEPAPEPPTEALGLAAPAVRVGRFPEFAPGLTQPHHQGIDPMSAARDTAVLLPVRVSTAQPFLAEARAAVAAAASRLRAVVAGFRKHPSYLRLTSIRQKLAAARREAAEAEAAPDRLRLKIREAYREGRDAPALEAELLAAAGKKDATATRAQALAEGVKSAEEDARIALHALVDAERERIRSEADARARELAGEILAAVGPRLAAFLVAHQIAGQAHRRRDVRESWSGLATPPDRIDSLLEPSLPT